jgi:hypothetical protein
MPDCLARVLIVHCIIQILFDLLVTAPVSQNIFDFVAFDHKLDLMLRVELSF